MSLTQLEPYMSNSSANFTFTGASLGPVANVKITGGSTNQTISTDGTGNLTFTNTIHPFMFTQ
jgi:hypothetical protein